MLWSLFLCGGSSPRLHNLSLLVFAVVVVVVTCSPVTLDAAPQALPGCQATLGNLTLCDLQDSSGDVKITWCKPNNPWSSAPAFFQPSASSNFPDPPVRCMGPPDDLWSECISVVSLELGEMRIRGTPIRLGLFGFSDGSFNLMDMNSRDFLVSTRQPNGFDGPAIHLGMAEVFNDTAVSGEDSILYFSGAGVDWFGVRYLGPCYSNCTHGNYTMAALLGGLFEPGNQVLDHTSLVSHWSKEYVSTTLVVQEDVHQHPPTRQFSLQWTCVSILEGSCLDPAWQTWRFQTPATSDHPVGVLSTALQLVNLTSYRLFQLEAQYNQSLTLVATDLELHVFAVEHQQGLDVELPWGQDTAPSLFVQYSPGGGTRILKAELFVEGTPRLNQAAFGEEKLCPTNIFLQPSEGVWLVVALEHQAQTPAYSVQIIELEEFAWISTPGTMLDPARRAESLCPDPNQVRDHSTFQCRDRHKHVIPMTEKPTDIKVRFKGPPEPFAQYLQSLEKFDLNSTLPCYLFKDVAPAYNACLSTAEEIRHLAKEITDCVGTNFFPHIFLFGAYARQVMQQVASEFLYNLIFISSGQRVRILALQPNWCAFSEPGGGTATRIQVMNSLDFVSPVYTFTVSSNGQHLLSGIGRYRWELQSIYRAAEICDRLYNEPRTSEFYKWYSHFLDQCRIGNPRKTLQFLDFVQYSSMCIPGSFCPSVQQQLIQAVPVGDFTFQPIYRVRCPKGQVCPTGAVQPCPTGYVCPEEGLLYPYPCSLNPALNTTCYNAYLSEPEPCPQGFICVAEYFQGLPTPNGTYVPVDGVRGDIKLCELGDWCSIARSANGNDTDELKTPAYFFATTPSQLVPTQCPCSASGCDFCPEGTWDPHLCPAGFYCSDPSVKAPCAFPDYCPNGTIVPSVCDAGFYCPNPATRIVCPEGSYCRSGSRDPTRCPPLSLCSEGSSSVTFSFLGILLDVIFFLAILIFWLLYLWLNRRASKLEEQGHLWGEGTPHLEKEESRPLLSENVAPDTFTMDLEFQSLGLRLKSGDKQVVLEGVTGSALHGTMTAVMGPSGAGKTTFLSTLCGRASYGVQTGQVLINGREDRIQRYRKVVGFVPQEDIMHRDLSVREILLFNAQMRLPKHISRDEIERRLEAVLDVLGLKEIENSLIGDETKRGISGGQRKRVNIGMELIADCKCLFLDEPTSGLDSRGSFEVCQALRKVSETGVTIVTVIHQPRYEIFTLFHRVLLLGKGGKTVFLGPSEEALDYFESLGFRCPDLVNPPDFFMDAIAGEVERKGGPINLFQAWEDYSQSTLMRVNSAEASVSVNNPSVPQEPMKSGATAVYVERQTIGIWRQMILFCARSLVQQTRDLASLVLDFALVFVGGFFLGLVFSNISYEGPPPAGAVDQCPLGLQDLLLHRPIYDPIPTEASLNCMTVSLTAMSAALRVFGTEKTVFRREASSGMNSFSYFLGKNLAYLPHSFLAPFVFLVVFFSLVVPVGSIVKFFCILVLVDFTSVGASFCVSILAPPSLSQLAGVLFVLMASMISGSFPTLVMLRDIVPPINILPNLSFLRWAQEAFYLTEISPWEDIFNTTPGFEQQGYHRGNFALDLLLLFVFGVLFRVLAYLVLLWKSRSSAT